MTHHDRPADKPANQPAVDTPENGQKLLHAAQGGQWLKGYDQDMTQKLKQDGVLGDAEVFDPSKVKQHLTADQQAHQTGAGALDKLHTQNTAARKAIDDSKAADQSVTADFHTVNSTLHDMMKASHKGADPLPEKTTVTKADLEGLVHNGTPQARAAAQRLLASWDKNHDLTSAAAEPGSPAKLRDGVDPFMNEVTLTRGMRKHDQARADQEKALAPSLAREQDMQKAQTALEQRMKDEQASLVASDKFLTAAKLSRGDGYYQAADRMLNLDGQKHTEAERKLMTRLLQQYLADERGGKVPQVLTYKDIKLTAQGIDKIFDRIKAVADKPQS
jgi:hypothetical protein